jgi:peptidyl-prolyl cis-trans isomerase B (cyclophilin B)
MQDEIKVRIALKGGQNIDVNLFPSVAPESVNNFLRYVDDKFYDGLCFHRVIPGFMIQGGGFTWEGGLKPKKGNAPIKGEFAANGVKNDLKHTPGVISMARTMDKNSATSQFFICVADTPYLDGQYAAFGKAADEESIKTAVEISKVDTQNWFMYGDVPVEPVIIESIRRI